MSCNLACAHSHVRCERFAHLAPNFSTAIISFETIITIKFNFYCQSVKEWVATLRAQTHMCDVKDSHTWHTGMTNLGVWCACNHNTGGNSYFYCQSVKEWVATLHVHTHTCDVKGSHTWHTWMTNLGVRCVYDHNTGRNLYFDQSRNLP